LRKNLHTAGGQYAVVVTEHIHCYTHCRTSYSCADYHC